MLPLRCAYLFLLVPIFLLMSVGAGACAETMSAQETAVDDLPQKTLLENIIGDIYEQLTETAAVDYEELQEDLLELASTPINLNTAQAADLERLHFLSNQQIDAILLYVYEHPMQTVAELQLIDCLQDYDIRNLRPFVCVLPVEQTAAPLNPHDVFRYAGHEITARLDVRNMEGYTGDPVFVQTRYKFNYSNRVQFGLNLRRPAGGDAHALEYGGYVQLNRLGCVQTVVAGNFQASFGQGLVFADAFHTGKSAYVLRAGHGTDGLRKYSGVDGNGLHGAGTTLGWQTGGTHIRLSALYSLQRTQDSVRHHTLGANLTVRYRRLKVGLTAMENLYSDSIYPYRDMRYNTHYFRGSRQAVLGLNFRYNYGLFDLFGEVATAQNRHWGVGLEVGSRITPVQGVGLLLLYRYYSPWFDNPQGYAFSETSRLNDENGLYLGAEITRLRRWRWAMYGDVFRFSGVKYSIPYAPSLGYDALLETDYLSSAWNLKWYLRAKEKARRGTYSTRLQFNWSDGGWRMRTQADANIVCDSTRSLTWGVSVYQDIQYTFPNTPVTLQMRLQGFDARKWDNRIYNYENDVLYGFSIPAVYGQGGRMYLNMRWQIIRQLGLYLRVSETVYSALWRAERSLAHATRTDIHLLLRATL